ncbi:MAG: hypothetical protein WCS53_05355 [Bacilli bacterium]|jgi:hypothetical protein
MNKKILFPAVLLALGLSVAGCSGGAEDDIEDLNTRIDALTSEIETLEREQSVLPFYLMDETQLTAAGYYKGVGLKDNNYHSDTVLFVKFANDGKIASILYSDLGNFITSGKHNASTPAMPDSTLTYLGKWTSNADTFLAQFVGLDASAVADYAITYTPVENSTSGQKTITIPSTLTVIAGVTYSSGMAAAAIQDACDAYLAAQVA